MNEQYRELIALLKLMKSIRTTRINEERIDLSSKLKRWVRFLEKKYQIDKDE